MNLFDMIITRPMGFIIEHIYGFVQNYGWAIIIFTVLIKLVVLPLTVKSQKAMKKQQKVQPYIAELQKKYANDQQKLQQEMMKVYKENNISMAGGCLPMLIQMPILVGLYQVIQKPLQFLLGVDFNLPESIDKVLHLQSAIQQAGENIGNLASSTMEQLANMSQIQLSSWSAKINGLGDPWAINFNFLGLDLSNVPMTGLTALISGNFSAGALSMLIIPIVAVSTTFVVSKLTQWQQKWNDKKNGVTSANTADTGAAAATSGAMMWMMPIMTGFFTLTLPSGLGIYWIISNAVQIVQQVGLDMYFNKKGDEFDVKLPEANRKKGKKRK
jgi:YidC/Oxa1 family membrane protein insertase